MSSGGPSRSGAPRSGVATPASRIRRGIQTVVEEIEKGTFGTAYRGSSLETVVHSIAEQRQLFKGADHAWLWKPKLRIPDIYEDPENQRAFGRFLDTCVCCQAEEHLLTAVHTLDEKGIKGLHVSPRVNVGKR